MRDLLIGFGVELSASEPQTQTAKPPVPSTSLCERFRDAIELGLSQGRNAMGIWQLCRSRNRLQSRWAEEPAHPEIERVITDKAVQYPLAVMDAGFTDGSMTRSATKTRLCGWRHFPACGLHACVVPTDAASRLLR